MVIIF